MAGVAFVRASVVAVVVLVGSLGAVLAPVAADDQTCTITGIVVDESLAPIAGADVVIIQLNWATQTDQSGLFEFVEVPVGQYSVAAMHQGYEPAVKGTACEADQVHEVVLLLVEIPPDPLPYVETYQFSGHIGCAAGVPLVGVSTLDQCAQIVGPDPPANRFRVTIHASPDAVTGTVSELEWTPTMSTSKCLALAYPSPHPDATASTNGYHHPNAAFAQGESVLYLRVDSSPGGSVYSYAQDTNVSFAVRPGHEGGGGDVEPLDPCYSTLVVDQPLEFWVSLFYNGVPVPDGYTHLQ